jgi:cysteine-rich repeat protein
MNPGETEICDKKDNDCDGLTDPGNTCNTPQSDQPVTVTGDSGQASVEFPRVTEAGETAISVETCEGQLEGFTLIPTSDPICVDIETTAEYEGILTVCITYDDTDLKDLESRVVMLHCDDNGKCTMIPCDPPIAVDIVNNVACGCTPTLSIFAVAIPLDRDGDDIPDVLDNCPDFYDPTNVCEGCLGDLDGDGDVDGSDVGVFASYYDGEDMRSDLNGDGAFDRDDVEAFAVHMGRTDCPICGDAIQMPGEECDDGNLSNGDGCDSLCRQEICGNGRLDFGEDCDDGNLVNNDGCEADCTVTIFEETDCSDGVDNDMDGDTDCSDADCLNDPACAICGDGVVGTGEECDDNNLSDGDGCDSLCRQEICGNGRLDFGEDCDDGNLVNNDGCEADCTVTIFTVFINEIHYDNASIDTGEAIEIAGPDGTNLSGWSIVLYNGSLGTSYGTIILSGTIPNQDNGWGTLSFPWPGIQNGSPDGLALVDSSSTVVQFLSYEGSFTAEDGPANGMTSTDIGVNEDLATPIGHSLQLSGSGLFYEDFVWQMPTASSFGSVNAGQTFGM